MAWYNRLRVRLLASQFLVAIVGVLVMMLATRVIVLSSAPDVIRPQLRALIEDPSLLFSTEQALILDFRSAVLWSVLIAALVAIAAGVASSMMMWRTLIIPLRQMAGRSRRIADGRYGERMAVPEDSGEAMTLLVSNFNEMAEALEQVEEQRVALLGNISHELRTPLTGLKGYIEGLLDGLFPSDEQTFGWMLNEVDRLGRLVADIQRLSRVEAGQIALELTSFDVSEVVSQVQAQLQPQALSQNIELVLEPAAAPVMVFADVDRTAQILINLVSNALRYTAAEGRISISVKLAGRMVELAVRDNGYGIPASAMPYIFERFYRADPSRARSSGGSGIGLTISRHLAWAMGGDILAASAGEDQGSTFVLTLPAVMSH